MPQKGKIKANIANMLTYIGQTYGNPKGAVKEYISNCIDAWLEARASGQANGYCDISILLSPHRLIIQSHSQPGQDRKGLKKMMEQVAESLKSMAKVPQIGRLAIGIFAFNLIGTKIVFFSKRGEGEDTWKLTLTKGSDQYELDKALKRESLEVPGLDVVISGLTQDPTRPRAALTPVALSKYLAQLFDYYLREGSLHLSIQARDQIWQVEPPPIGLPVVAEAFMDCPIRGNFLKRVQCSLWFDPSNEGKIAVCHTKIPIINDMRSIDEIQPGFGETIYASGYLRGFINADFLNPLSGRAGFEMDAQWQAFMVWLSAVEPSIRKEVEDHQLEKETRYLEEIKDKAKKLAEEILEGEPFQELELLGGMRREHGKKIRQRTNPRGKETGTRAEKKTGQKEDPRGFRFNYKEVGLDDVWRHSIFEGGIIKINTTNSNYKRLVGKGTARQKLRYFTLMIGKETVGCNDHNKLADYYLEKLIAFSLALDSKMTS